MRLSAHDDYGIRLLLRIARGEEAACMTTAVLAEREGMSMSHVGKVLKLLRDGGFVESTRGNCGGYKLTRQPEDINVGAALAALGGRLYEAPRAASADETAGLCTGSVDCAMDALWRMVQFRMDRLLDDIYLSDLIGTENATSLTLAGKLGIASTVSR